MNRITKIWEELDHKQGRVKLSATAKKGRKVELNTTEQFQDTISIAFDNEYLIQEYDSMMAEIDAFISSNRQKLEDLVGYVAPWDSLSEKLLKQKEGIDKAKESLGIDYTDLGMDYDAGDISEAIRIFATLRGKDEELMDAFTDLKKFISDYE